MSQNPYSRIKEHNKGKVRTTKAGRPWKLVIAEKAPSREIARKREKYRKSAAGRRRRNKILQASSNFPVILQFTAT